MFTYVCVCVCYLVEVLCPAACLPELPCHSPLNAHYFAHFIILSHCRVCAECVCECVCVRAEVSLYCAATSLLLSLSLVQLLFECIAHSNALFENLLNTFCQGERFALCLPSAKKGCGTSCQIKWEKEKQKERDREAKGSWAHAFIMISLAASLEKG